MSCVEHPRRVGRFPVVEAPPWSRHPQLAADPIERTAGLGVLPVDVWFGVSFPYADNGVVDPGARALRPVTGPKCASGGLLAARETLVLATQTVNGEDRAVALHVVLPDVVEKSTSLTDHHQQTTTGVVIVFVLFEVIVEIGDSGGEDGNLHFGGSGIGFAGAVRGNNSGFVEHENRKIFR